MCVCAVVFYCHFRGRLWLWCWEGLGAGGEGGDRGWDGWMASLTRWTWVWVNSGSWWWTGRPGMLRFMGSQTVGHDWVTELNWTDGFLTSFTHYNLHTGIDKLREKSLIDIIPKVLMGRVFCLAVIEVKIRGDSLSPTKLWCFPALMLTGRM